MKKHVEKTSVSGIPPGGGTKNSERLGTENSERLYRYLKLKFLAGSNLFKCWSGEACIKNFVLCL